MKFVMDDPSSINEVKDELSLLTKRFDALLKITESVCEHLISRDCEFEKLLAKKFLNVLGSGKKPVSQQIK
jgi:hypothetical protein